MAATLPFRFKAGGDGTMASVAHHHRSTTKTIQKPFKSKHASKNTLRDRSKGRTERIERGARKTPHQTVMSKFDRRNHAKQKRLNKDREHASAINVFAGKDGAPRIVAILPLCEDVSGAAAVRSLNAALDLQEEQEIPDEGCLRVNIDRFKQKIQYLVTNRDLWDALDAGRAADYVVLVLSAEQEVDETGEALLRALESQGISNVLTVVQGLNAVEPAKKRPQISASLKSFILHFLPNQEKVYSLDTRQDCTNVVRSLCSTIPKGIRWREDRSWILAEEVRWPGAKNARMEDNAAGEVILTGVVRGKPLKSNRLVQVGDWGFFQISKITAAPLAPRRKDKADSMAVDLDSQEAVLEQPTEDQDDLNELAPEKAVMADADDMTVSVAPSEKKGVLLDDHHYFSEDETEEVTVPKRLPRGTSKYQSAWYLGDESDSGSDMEEVDWSANGGLGVNGSANSMDGMDVADGISVAGAPDPTEAGPSEYPQSEMFLDPSPDEEAEELAAYRAQKKKEVEDDLEFPDEIELHPNVLAKERLAKYRGLKSLRTSQWDTEEDKPYQPTEWSRLLEIGNYKAARSRFLKEALVGGVKPGTRVHIHLRNVPLSFQQAHNASKPITLFSLLRHEHKRTAMNFSITLSSDYAAPLKAKEELVMQCGPRRMIVSPLFSQAGNTPNDVHKFDRYLHPGRSAVASFVAPLTWGAVPTLFFKRNAAGDMDLIATGTSLPPSTSRIIAKRVILTGHPFKIHKRLVTVRYMFFNKEDVAWFKALPLWTKSGKKGFIKESLGTHGYFKAVFDGRINPMDAVGVTLWKRVWPRDAKAWRPEAEGEGSGEVVERMEE